MIRFVSLLTPDFKVPLEVLAFSLCKNGNLPSGTSWDIILLGDTIDLSFLERMGFVLRIHSIEDIGRIELPYRMNKPRRRLHFQKLCVLNMPGPGPYVFLDVDMVCLGDVSEMSTWDHFTGIPEILPKNTEFERFKNDLPKDSHVMNTGVFAFRPDEELFRNVMEHANEIAAKGKIYVNAEQGLLNAYFALNRCNFVKWESYKYNTSYNSPDTSDTRILHFHGKDNGPWLQKKKRKVNEIWWQLHQEFNEQETERAKSIVAGEVSSVDGSRRIQPPVNVKQVIVMRKDLGMTKGKMISQGAHASMKVILKIADINSDRMEIRWEPGTEAIEHWLMNQFKKICVGVNNESELRGIFEAAEKAGLPCAMVEDIGLTKFKGVVTRTCCGIGPADATEIDKITGKLKLL